MAAGCGAGEPAAPAAPEPGRVLVDRILVSYRGNPLGIPARRSLADARDLAERIRDRARAGEDFAALRERYSDDRPPGGSAAGPYVLLNTGLEPLPTMLHVPRMHREHMGRRFGEVAFRLAEGEIGFVAHDAREYPAGFEVLRCIARDFRTPGEIARDLQGGPEPPK